MQSLHRVFEFTAFHVEFLEGQPFTVYNQSVVNAAAVSAAAAATASNAVAVVAAPAVVPHFHGIRLLRSVVAERDALYLAEKGATRLLTAVAKKIHAQHARVNAAVGSAAAAEKKRAVALARQEAAAIAAEQLAAQQAAIARGEAVPTSSSGADGGADGTVPSSSPSLNTAAAATGAAAAADDDHLPPIPPIHPRVVIGKAALSLPNSEDKRLAGLSIDAAMASGYTAALGQYSAAAQTWHTAHNPNHNGYASTSAFSTAAMGSVGGKKAAGTTSNKVGAKGTAANTTISGGKGGAAAAGGNGTNNKGNNNNANKGVFSFDGGKSNAESQQQQLPFDHKAMLSELQANPVPIVSQYGPRRRDQAAARVLYAHVMLSLFELGQIDVPLRMPSCSSSSSCSSSHRNASLPHDGGVGSADIDGYNDADSPAAVVAAALVDRASFAELSAALKQISTLSPTANYTVPLILSPPPPSSSSSPSSSSPYAIPHVKLNDVWRALHASLLSPEGGTQWATSTVVNPIIRREYLVLGGATKWPREVMAMARRDAAAAAAAAAASANTTNMNQRNSGGGCGNVRAGRHTVSSSLAHTIKQQSALPSSKVPISAAHFLAADGCPLKSFEAAGEKELLAMLRLFDEASANADAEGPNSSEDAANGGGDDGGEAADKKGAKDATSSSSAAAASIRLSYLHAHLRALESLLTFFISATPSIILDQLPIQACYDELTYRKYWLIVVEVAVRYVMYPAMRSAWPDYNNPWLSSSSSSSSSSPCGGGASSVPALRASPIETILDKATPAVLMELLREAIAYCGRYSNTANTNTTNIDGAGNGSVNNTTTTTSPFDTAFFDYRAAYHRYLAATAPSGIAEGSGGGGGVSSSGPTPHQQQQPPTSPSKVPQQQQQHRPSAAATAHLLNGSTSIGGGGGAAHNYYPNNNTNNVSLTSASLTGGGPLFGGAFGGFGMAGALPISLWGFHPFSSIGPAPHTATAAAAASIRHHQQQRSPRQHQSNNNDGGRHSPPPAFAPSSSSSPLIHVANTNTMDEDNAAAAAAMLPLVGEASTTEEESAAGGGGMAGIIIGVGGDLSARGHHHHHVGGLAFSGDESSHNNTTTTTVASVAGVGRHQQDNTTPPTAALLQASTTTNNTNTTTPIHNGAPRKQNIYTTITTNNAANTSNNPNSNPLPHISGIPMAHSVSVHNGSTSLVSTYAPPRHTNYRAGAGAAAAGGRGGGANPRGGPARAGAGVAANSGSNLDASSSLTMMSNANAHAAAMISLTMGKRAARQGMASTIVAVPSVYQQQRRGVGHQSGGGGGVRVAGPAAGGATEAEGEVGHGMSFLQSFYHSISGVGFIPKSARGGGRQQQQQGQAAAANSTSFTAAGGNYNVSTSTAAMVVPSASSTAEGEEENQHEGDVPPFGAIIEATAIALERLANYKSAAASSAAVGGGGVRIFADTNPLVGIVDTYRGLDGESAAPAAADDEGASSASLALLPTVHWGNRLLFLRYVEQQVKLMAGSWRYLAMLQRLGVSIRYSTAGLTVGAGGGGEKQQTATSTTSININMVNGPLITRRIDTTSAKALNAWSLLCGGGMGDEALVAALANGMRSVAAKHDTLMQQLQLSAAVGVSVGASIHEKEASLPTPPTPPQLLLPIDTASLAGYVGLRLMHYFERKSALLGRWEGMMSSAAAARAAAASLAAAGTGEAAAGGTATGGVASVPADGNAHSNAQQLSEEELRRNLMAELQFAAATTRKQYQQQVGGPTTAAAAAAATQSVGKVAGGTSSSPAAVAGSCLTPDVLNCVNAASALPSWVTALPTPLPVNTCPPSGGAAVTSVAGVAGTPSPSPSPSFPMFPSSLPSSAHELYALLELAAHDMALVGGGGGIGDENGADAPAAAAPSSAASAVKAPLLFDSISGLSSMAKLFEEMDAAEERARAQALAEAAAAANPNANGGKGSNATMITSSSSSPQPPAAAAASSSSVVVFRSKGPLLINDPLPLPRRHIVSGELTKVHRIHGMSAYYVLTQLLPKQALLLEAVGWSCGGYGGVATSTIGDASSLAAAAAVEDEDNNSGGESAFLTEVGGGRGALNVPSTAVGAGGQSCVSATALRPVSVGGPAAAAVGAINANIAATAAAAAEKANGGGGASSPLGAKGKGAAASKVGGGYGGASKEPTATATVPVVGPPLAAMPSHSIPLWLPSTMVLSPEEEAQLAAAAAARDDAQTLDSAATATDSAAASSLPSSASYYTHRLSVPTMMKGAVGPACDAMSEEGAKAVLAFIQSRVTRMGKLREVLLLSNSSGALSTSSSSSSSSPVVAEAAARSAYDALAREVCLVLVRLWRGHMLRRVLMTPEQE